MAKVIVFGSQKGGVGKSTLTVGVAGAWAQAKAHVLVVDADPQGSAYYNLQGHKRIDIARHEDGDIAELLPSLTDEYDYIIVDTPSGINQALLSSLKIATLLVIPTKASKYDLHSAGATVRAAHAAKCKAVFVCNEIDARVRLTKDTVEALKAYGIPVCEQMIASRQAHRQAAVDDQTVTEIKLNGQKAAREIEHLAIELLAHMRG